MKRTRVLGVVLVIVGAGSAGSCGRDGDGAGTATPDELGAAVYAEACASCHGADLRGTDKGPSHLSVVYERNHHPDSTFRNAITNGSPQHHWSFGAMPAVEGLSEDEVEAVIAFVRARQDEEGLEPYPPPGS